LAPSISTPKDFSRGQTLGAEARQTEAHVSTGTQFMPFQPFQATRDFTKASIISQVDKDRGYVERPERTSTPPRGQVVIPRRELTLEEWKANNRALERGEDC